MKEKKIVVERKLAEYEGKGGIFRKSEETDHIGVEWVFLGDIDQESNREISFFLDGNQVSSQIKYRLGIIVIRLAIDKDTVRGRKYVNIDNPKGLQKCLFGSIRSIEKSLIIGVIPLKEEIEKCRHNSHYHPKDAVFIFSYANFFLIGRDHRVKH